MTDLAFKTTSDASVSRFRGVIYGEPGVGKTTLARTARGLGRVCIISGEGGLQSLAKIDPPMDVLEFKNYSHLETIVEMIRNDQFSDFDVLYVDSLSEAGKIIDQYFYDKYAVVDEETGLLTVPKKDNFKYFGDVAMHKSHFLRVIRDSNKHVFLSALAKTKEDNDTGQRTVGPAYGMGSAADNVKSDMDFVFALRWFQSPEGEPVRGLQTIQHDDYYTKLRGAVGEEPMPSVIYGDDIDLTKIVRGLVG